MQSYHTYNIQKVLRLLSFSTRFRAHDSDHHYFSFPLTGVLGGVSINDTLFLGLPSNVGLASYSYQTPLIFLFSFRGGGLILEAIDPTDEVLAVSDIPAFITFMFSFIRPTVWPKFSTVRIMPSQVLAILTWPFPRALI